jgi:D-alanine transaminase
MLKPGEIADVYKPMRCISLEDTRFLHCNIKTINLIPAVMATQTAVEAGADEAILHRGDIVTECAHSNVSILKNGTIYTHPTNNLILPGIARAHLLREAKKLGLGVVEEPYTITDLMDADEIIITATSALCMRVIELDGKPVGGKDADTVKRLQDALLNDYLEETSAQ